MLVKNFTHSSFSVFCALRSQSWQWIAILFGALYMIAPVDLIPDFFPLIGFIDDLLVFLVIVPILIAMLRSGPPDR